LSKAVRSLGIADHIIMPGYVRDSELQALYSAASLCVIPSHYEGFGFPVLEAMASGTPVLTSNVSATKEVAANPDMLVEPDDIDAWTAKIYQALTDERFRNRLIEHGRSQSQKFSWRQTAREMINVYEGAHQSKPKIANLKTKVSVENYHALPDVVMQSELPHFANVSALSNAVLCTLVYSDLFHYPLKLEEIHEGLVGYKASIDEVKDVLQGEELKRYVDYANGFYFLKDVKEKIDNRKLNEQTSHKILLKNRRLLKFICNFPFVRAVALSGAIAFNNCKSNDDVDLFLLIDSKRIWCVYFVLAALLKVLRKRNLICLNYLYGKEDLVVNETDFYVAHQIANLRPISGNGVLADFISANEWILNYLPQTKPGNSNYVSGKNGQLDMNGKNVESRSKRALEKFLGLDMFNQIEDWVFRVYSGHIRKITSHLNGSVVVEKDQIKLFTHDHRQRILSKFKTRLDEIAKL
ncbi:glycosyltransferase family 4 protein, partial [candidate division KSB1 bacterium]|nr:glycosyltransferase family 4 protein [candidate division KSB1 bacterium]NIR69271.1 glycosyltransferase family 4 protein [candidate division KSB1 bacterium]NIS24132.1 glycosyltransferase family 4 protein [candidate division KSB1 bacterium]NIT71046.1 glycosyltransferase family 4 protein [candidate division KSB1 bacterium]NIU24751.1 glycosyltransferase family 4 protein [candidate division KSB1 bacterium]